MNERAERAILIGRPRQVTMMMSGIRVVAAGRQLQSRRLSGGSDMNVAERDHELERKRKQRQT
jgi:hypothetical protein